MKLSTIESYIDKYIEIWPFSGTIGVLNNEKVVYNKSFGMACHEYGIPNNIDTCYTLGSMSKQFTAFLVMFLYEHKRIDIDKPINLYLQKELYIDDRITAHHLLSHTSGLHQFYNWEDDFFQIYDRSTFNRKDFFTKFIKRPLSFEPGDQFEYNNANYNILAWAIENIVGINFGEALKKYIFDPLGMKNTVLDDGHIIIKNKAFPYQMDRNEIVRCQYYNEKFSVGAGAVLSNFDDLCKWYYCLKNKMYLSDNTYTRFFTENKDGYCYGLNKDKVYGRTRFYHGGDHLGVMTYRQDFYDDDICIVVLSNLDCGNNYHIGNCITEIIFNGQTEEPKRIPEVKLDKASLSKYEGVYYKDKIVLELGKEGLEFLRFNGDVHHLLYPVGKNKFARKWSAQTNPYELKECEDGSFEFFGFKKE